MEKKESWRFAPGAASFFPYHEENDIIFFFCKLKVWDLSQSPSCALLSTIYCRSLFARLCHLFHLFFASFFTPDDRSSPLLCP